MNSGFRLGLYGCGNRTKALLNSLRLDGFYQVQAAYDLNFESAKKLTEFYGGIPYASPEEMKADKNVDAWLVSLSPFAHADALKELIPLGKPVFVEKPVAFTGEAVRELRDLAEKYHVPVQVGFMRRYLPHTIEMLKYIKENPTGAVFSVDCEWIHHGATEMNHCLYHKPKDFRMKVSQIPFHCCHMLDIMLLLNGPVKRVNSTYMKVIDRPYPSPDEVFSTLEYANGSYGRFHYSSMSYFGTFNYRFYCENYTISMDLLEGGLKIYRKPRFKTSELGPDPEHTPDFSEFNRNFETLCGPMTLVDKLSRSEVAAENIMYDFVKTVRDGMTPVADLTAAVRVQGLAEAIEMSGKLKRTIELDADGVPYLK